MKDHKDSVFGAILGGAIGDSMGYYTEFKTIGTGTPQLDLGPDNRFSDDTQMGMAIAEAILTAGVDDTDALMRQMANNWIRWDKGLEVQRWGANNRAPGGTCMSGVRDLERGVNWMRSGATARGKGNGGPMRSGYVGALLWQDPKLAYEIGGLTSIPTHNNIEAVMASAAVSFLVAASINGIPWALSISHLLDLVSNYNQTLRVVPQIGAEDYPDWAIGRLGSAFALGKSRISEQEWQRYNTAQFRSNPNVFGSDGKAIEAVAAAIFYNTRSRNYSDTIHGLVNHTGDSDTTACIGGIIAGARWGAQFIPTTWLETVEKSEYLHNLAGRVWDWSTGDEEPEQETAPEPADTTTVQ